MKRFLFCLFLVLILVSCEEMFTPNIFGNFEKYDKPNISAANVEDLLEETTDDRFFDELTEDDIEVIEEKAKNVYLTGNNSQKTSASLLAADVQIKTSGADEVFDNVVPVFSDIIDEGEEFSFEDPEIIKDFFPSKKKEDIVKQLEAFEKAAHHFSKCGEAISGDENLLLQKDDNPQDTAAKALVSGIVAVLIELNSAEELADAIISEDGFDNLDGPDSSDEGGTADQLEFLLGDNDFAENIVSVIGAGINLDKLKL